MSRSRLLNGERCCWMGWVRLRPEIQVRRQACRRDGRAPKTQKGIYSSSYLLLARELTLELDHPIKMNVPPLVEGCLIKSLRTVPCA